VVYVRSLYSVIASPGRIRTRYRSNVGDPGDGRHDRLEEAVLFAKTWVSCGVSPRKQVIELAVRMAVDDSAEDVGQIGEWLDVTEFGDLDQGSNRRPTPRSSVAAGEEGV
jgi:hypothetical protein